MRLGPTEILVLVLIVLLLFGASRLPKLARAMREARQEFEKGKDEEPPSSKSEAPPAGSQEPASDETPTEKA